MDCDQREAFLQGPRVHDGFDVRAGREDAVDAGLLRHEVPQIILAGVFVLPSN